MKCQNGSLRNDHDVTLCLRAYVQKEHVKWEEYGPFAALAALLVGLLIKGLN